MSALVKTAAGVIQITLTPDGLALDTPYDPLFVADLKSAIPHGARRWDGTRRQWLVDPVHGPRVLKLLSAHYGVALELPTGDAAQPARVTEVLQLAYLGGCREREDKSVSASGYALGNRNAKAPDLVFPEAVLKAWFEGAKPGATPDAKAAPPASLYAVLCIAQDADAAALKSAYRRMARQTHPDVNKEPDAADLFRRVQDAYVMLSNPVTRRKYDAGLALAARFAAESDPKRGRFDLSMLGRVYGSGGPFRAPLRCGLLLVTGVRRLGRLHVETILSWEDLARPDGRVLVSSWPTGAELWTEEWVTP